MKTRSKLGDWVSICDDCQEKFHASQLREMWDGKFVCTINGCWERRHPADFYKITEDDQSVPWSRPEGTASFEDDSGWVDTSTQDPDDTGHNDGSL